MSNSIDIFSYKYDVDISNNYTWINKDEWLNKYLSFELLNIPNKDSLLICDKLSFGLYSFPLMNKLFCTELITILDKYDKWTTGRHNHYATNDILLKNFNWNLYKIVNNIIRYICVPIVNKLFLSGFNIKDLNIEETFIVRYKHDIQPSLGIHHDQSTFTIVLNLTDLDQYEGGGTYFIQHDLLVKKEAGMALIHPGQLTHKHGVRPIIKGCRYCIVSFVKRKI